MIDPKDRQRDQSPKVSVVIPAYDVAPYIVETVHSVFAQTFKDYEIIIINDGSPDTPELENKIAAFKDKIVYLEQPNGGAAAARNAGIRAASGELLAFLDGDDIWEPQFLESQIAFLEANNLDMVYADALLFGENVGKHQTYMQNSVSRGAVTTKSLIDWTCNVITSGTVVRRIKIIEAGFFDESPLWKQAQDFEMWFRLVILGAKVGYQREALLKYRIRRGSLSGNSVEQAERNINALQGINDKFALTSEEKTVLDKQMKMAHSMLAVELGRSALQASDFNGARKHFAHASPLYSRPKQVLLKIALLVAPRAVQRLITERAD